MLPYIAAPWILWVIDIHLSYPLVNIQKAIEHGDLVRGFTH